MPVLVRARERALERLPDIPVRDFPFDVASRAFLPYDPIVGCSGNDDVHRTAARRERRQGEAGPDGRIP